MLLYQVLRSKRITNNNSVITNSNLSSWIGVECWCDFGANLVQHFIGRYSRCSRNRTKTHDKATISHDISRYSRYQTVFLKLQEIKTLCLWHSSKPTFRGGFLFLSLENNEINPLRWFVKWPYGLEIRWRDWNALRCIRIYFISRCWKHHFKTALPSFQARLCRAFHSSLLFPSSQDSQFLNHL